MSIECHVQDIRSFESAENLSTEMANSIDLFRGRIPDSILAWLSKVYDAASHLTYTILTSSPLTSDYVEGRGKYHLIDVDGTHLVFYTKGNGSVKALQEGRTGAFAAFGEVGGNLFIDGIDHKGHYPRIWGTQSALWAKMELLDSSRIFYGLLKGFGMRSPEEVVKAGLTLPVNAVHLASLTDYFAEPSEREVEKGSSWKGHIDLGSSGIVVPGISRVELLDEKSNRRSYLEQKQRVIGTLDKSEISLRALDSTDSFDSYYRIGFTLRNLVQYAYIITSPASQHYQNFFLADNSLCVQADNSDMLPLELLSQEERHLQIYNALLNLGPFLPMHDVAEHLEETNSFLFGLTQDDVKAPVLTRLWPVYGQEIMIAIADYLLAIASPRHVDDVIKNYHEMGLILDGGVTLKEIESLTEGRINDNRRNISVNPLFICRSSVSEMVGMPAGEILACKRNQVSRDILNYLLYSKPLSGDNYIDASRINDLILSKPDDQAGYLVSSVQSAFWGMKTDLEKDIIYAFRKVLQHSDSDTSRMFVAGVSCALHTRFGEKILDDQGFKGFMRPIINTQPKLADDIFLGVTGIGNTKPEYQGYVFDRFMDMMSDISSYMPLRAYGQMKAFEDYLNHAGMIEEPKK